MIFGDSPTLRNDRFMPSIHAIMQASNLFVFGINNPVRWLDPTGLMIGPRNELSNTLDGGGFGAGSTFTQRLPKPPSLRKLSDGTFVEGRGVQ